MVSFLGEKDDQKKVLQRWGFGFGLFPINGCLKSDHIFYWKSRWTIFQHNNLTGVDTNCLVSFLVVINGIDLVSFLS